MSAPTPIALNGHRTVAVEEEKNGAYSLMVEPRIVAPMIRVRFPLGTHFSAYYNPPYQESYVNRALFVRIEAMREENTFEDPVVAKEWIRTIEAEHDFSRDREIYPFLKEWVRTVSPRVLAEIGSGQGICSSKIRIPGKYIGIEPSRTLVDRAKQRYKSSRKKFLMGNAYKIPLKKHSVDAVFSLGVWFHIKDLAKAHCEIVRTLKPSGELLIITANPDRYGLWEKWFDSPTKHGKKITGRIKVPTGWLSKNIFYFHKEEEIIGSLKKNGFYIRSIVKFGHGRERGRDEGAWMAIWGFKKEK